MKRTNKTAIALATAGALGFGIVPMADAQDTRPTHQTATDSENDLTAVPTTGGEEFVPGNVPTEGSNPDNTAPLPGTAQPGQTRPAGDKREEGTPSPEGEIKVDENGNPYPTQPSTPLPTGLTEQPGENFKETERIEREVNGKKQVLWEDENGVQFWHNVNAEGQPVDRDGNRISGLHPAKTEKKPGETTEKDALPVVLGVLGGLAGLGLVIAGVNYWVNKDGNLVTDPDKVNEPSKPEDAANTKKIVGENVDEVAQQVGIDPATGQPVDGGERGIGASTGVNKIPAALLSLLLASVLGAAAFVFGRRQLV